MRISGRLKRINHLAVIVFIVAVILPSLSQTAKADPFDRYREFIDNFKAYDIYQREDAINELEKYTTSDIEKKYLLGMLYFIQALETMTSIARSKPYRPKFEKVLKDSTVQKYFGLSEKNYDAVENENPGYKYIYCKYVELYRYSLNEEGLKKIVAKVGEVEENERTQQCKDMIAYVAKDFAKRGRLNISRTILDSAINSWPSYPKYMNEAMGDIEIALENHKQAMVWWERCVEEAEDEERRQRCLKKIDNSYE